MIFDHTIVQQFIRRPMRAKIEGATMLDTLGERIKHLLINRGRQDTGEPYRQTDLHAWLTGQTPGPNGKKYAFDVSVSHVSQLLNDKLEMRVVQEIQAIGEMLGEPAGWLLFGEVQEDTSRTSICYNSL